MMMEKFVDDIARNSTKPPARYIARPVDTVQRRINTKETIADVYRRCMAPAGLRKVRRHVAAGLPAQFVDPLEFLFGVPLNEQDRDRQAEIEVLRERLAGRNESFEPLANDGRGCRRAASRIAHVSSTTPYWGGLLYLCSKSAQSRSILELGACAGISGSYLAAPDTCEQFTSIEASESLLPVAKAHIQAVHPEARVVHGLFDDVLDDVLQAYSDGIDLVHIDGNHFYEPTLRYTDWISPHVNPGGLMVFDDIRWSQEMWQAWQVLRRRPGFSWTIDTGRVGLCRWEGGDCQPQQLRLSVYTGFLLVGHCK